VPSLPGPPGPPPERHEAGSRIPAQSSPRDAGGFYGGIGDDDNSLAQEWRGGPEGLRDGGLEEPGLGPCPASSSSRPVQRYTGTLITIHQAGYGWIRSDGLNKNAWVAKKFIEGIPLHSRVSFRTQVNDRGLAAVNVQLEEAPAAEDAETGQGQPLPLKYEGILKKVDRSAKSFGFIFCSDAGRAWDGDVYVSGKLLDGHKDLCVGDKVRFSAKVGNKGKAEAMQMEPVREVEEEEAEVDGPEMIGTIKSFDESSGYGFICGTRITQEYGRDVFLHRKQLKGFKVGDMVQFNVVKSRDGKPQASKLREAPDGSSSQPTETLAAPEPPPKQDEKEVFLGEIKSFNPMNGYGFIHCGALFERFRRDVFLHESQFEGLKVGDCVTFVIQMKKGAPQALEVKRVSKKLKGAQLALTVSAPTGETQDAAEAVAEAAGEAAVPSADEQPDPEECAKQSRKLLRACASQRTESVQDMLDALEAGAEVHARDVTGQNALMVSALNMRGAERKCRLLLEHKADVNLPSDPNGTKTTLEWTKERINPKFAAFLEAISKGEEAELAVSLEGPSAEEP